MCYDVMWYFVVYVMTWYVMIDMWYVIVYVTWYFMWYVKLYVMLYMHVNIFCYMICYVMLCAIFMYYVKMLCDMWWDIIIIMWYKVILTSSPCNYSWNYDIFSWWVCDVSAIEILEIRYECTTGPSVCERKNWQNRDHDILWSLRIAIRFLHVDPRRKFTSR